MTAFHYDGVTGAPATDPRDAGGGFVGHVDAGHGPRGDGWAGTCGWCGSTDVVDVEENPILGAPWGVCGQCAKPDMNKEDQT